MLNQLPVIAVHQPTFMPYLGYFHKIAKSDAFIYYDDVVLSQSPANGYTKRTALAKNNLYRWLTIPTGSSQVPINDLRFGTDLSWKSKHLNIISDYYRKCPYFDDVMPLVLNAYLGAMFGLSVAQFNIDFIEYWLDYVGIAYPRTMLRSSHLDYDRSHGKAHRVYEVCDTVACGHPFVYLTGTGALDYILEDPRFEVGRNLQISKFQMKEYHQHNSPDTFIPGCSILDAAMNVSKEELLKLILNEQQSNESDT